MLFLSVLPGNQLLGATAELCDYFNTGEGWGWGNKLSHTVFYSVTAGVLQVCEGEIGDQ